MVYFTDSQTYIQQSQLLLQARPTTTRITTRYTLAKPTTTPQDSSTTSTQQKSRGLLVLKTYDPVSGTCLKYRTNKAAEVGRLVAGLGRCARVMAAQDPDAEEPAQDEAVMDVEAEIPAGGATAAASSGKLEAQSGGAGSGAGKKKKKSKR